MSSAEKFTQGAKHLVLDIRHEMVVQEHNDFNS